MDDQTIELKLYDALNQQLPPGNRISATCYNSTVLLTGEAVSEAARQRAEMIARSVTPPVREVYNELVVGRPRPFSDRSNDGLLTAKVKTALFQIKINDFDPTRVKVVTERGVVGGDGARGGLSDGFGTAKRSGCCGQRRQPSGRRAPSRDVVRVRQLSGSSFTFPTGGRGVEKESFLPCATSRFLALVCVRDGSEACLVEVHRMEMGGRRRPALR